MNQSHSIGFIRNQSNLQKIVLSKAFWMIFILFGFVFPIYRSLNRKLPLELPVMYKIPQFELTNHFGKPFGSKDLFGKVYLSNFIFTSCPSSCPLTMKKTQIIQKRLRGLGTKVAILSFSVDPKTDTPEVLNKFAMEYKANPYVWSFLTGSSDKVKDLLVKGFKVAVGDKDPTMMDIAHSDKIILVDGFGMVRGIYSSDKQSVDQMMIDVGILINKKISGS
jgi:protein SCO1/2